MKASTKKKQMSASVLTILRAYSKKVIFLGPWLTLWSHIAGKRRGSHTEFSVFALERRRTIISEVREDDNVKIVLTHTVWACRDHMTIIGLTYDTSHSDLKSWFLQREKPYDIVFRQSWDLRNAKYLKMEVLIPSGNASRAIEFQSPNFKEISEFIRPELHTATRLLLEKLF